MPNVKCKMKRKHKSFCLQTLRGTFAGWRVEGWPYYECLVSLYSSSSSIFIIFSHTHLSCILVAPLGQVAMQDAGVGGDSVRNSLCIEDTCEFLVAFYGVARLLGIALLC